MADLQAKREKLNKEAEAGLSEFLSEDQIKRLDQIALQQRGLRALTDDDTGKKLGISAEQKTKIEAVFAASDEARRQMFQGGRGGDQNGDNQQGGRGGRGNFDPAAFAAMREKMEEARKKTETDVLAVLTDAQKKQFDEMKGAPFELNFGGFGGGRPGGFGGGRPGQGGGRPGGNRPGTDGGDRPRRPSAE
ncbi:hypothetical protein GC176_00790 [bacterium]|nr:hypothetical protein [bacterium]